MAKKKPEKKPEKVKGTRKNPNRPRNHRRYSDLEKLAALTALDLNAGNVLKTARELGMNHLTLQEWKHGRGIPAEVLANHEGARKNLADRFEEVAHLLLSDLMRPEKIAVTRVRDVAVSVSIAVDKMRLLREQPTTIKSNHDITPDELVRRVRSLADRVRSLPRIVPPSGDSDGVVLSGEVVDGSDGPELQGELAGKS